MTEQLSFKVAAGEGAWDLILELICSDGLDRVGRGGAVRGGGEMVGRG